MVVEIAKIHQTCFDAYLGWLTRCVKKVSVESFFTASGLYVDAANYKIFPHVTAWATAKGVSHKIEEYCAYYRDVAGLRLVRPTNGGFLDLDRVLPPQDPPPRVSDRPDYSYDTFRDDVWLWRVGEKNVNTPSQVIMNLAWRIGIDWRYGEAAFHWGDTVVRFSVSPTPQSLPREMNSIQLESEAWRIARDAESSLNALLFARSSIPYAVRLNFSSTSPTDFWWDITQEGRDDN